MAIENASYQVLLKEGKFEIRLYKPMVIVTCLETDLSGGEGFNRLFNYINGNNQESMKIAMTSPVINFLEDQKSTTAFVMPGKYELQQLPQPIDSRLQLKEIKERQIAAIIFTGHINEKVISNKKIELLEWLKEKHMIAVGETELARYNPPYIPTFLRRNELMIEIQSQK